MLKTGFARRKEKAPAAVGRQRGIILKSQREIELIRSAGRVVHSVLNRMREILEPGVSTADLNTVAERMIAEAGGVPLFKGVKNPHAKFPFPAVLCTSVNQELVHGIPNTRPLRQGDIVSIDCGVRLAGYCGDAAVTLSAGAPTPQAMRLMEVTQGALDLAINAIRPGRRWSEVAREIQAYVERRGMSVVRDFVGHGIGRDMHEEPKVPNYWDRKQKNADFELVPRMVIAVEPMVNLGGHAVDYGTSDRWVVVTQDGALAAHYEHTVAVTENGADILTDGR